MARRLDQTLRRDPEHFVKLPDHDQGQVTLTIENLVDVVALAYGGLQTLGGKIFLPHPKLDGLDRVRSAHGELLRFVVLDHSQQDAEAVSVLGAELRLIVEVCRYLAQGGLVLNLGANRANIHISLHLNGVGTHLVIFLVGTDELDKSRRTKHNAHDRPYTINN